MDDLDVFSCYLGTQTLTNVSNSIKSNLPLVIEADLKFSLTMDDFWDLFEAINSEKYPLSVCPSIWVFLHHGFALMIVH